MKQIARYDGMSPSSYDSQAHSHRRAVLAHVTLSLFCRSPDARPAEGSPGLGTLLRALWRSIAFCTATPRTLSSRDTLAATPDAGLCPVVIFP